MRDNAYLRTVFPNSKQQHLTVRELLSKPGVARAETVSTPGTPREGRSPGTPSTLTDLAVRQRAAGALLHTLQDSFTASHAARNGKGEITEFHSSPGQDETRHHQADEWVVHNRTAKPGKTLGKRIDELPGARAAVDRGGELLRLLDQSAPPETIRKFLGERVFNLADPQELRPAGPGEEFRPRRG